MKSFVNLPTLWQINFFLLICLRFRNLSTYKMQHNKYYRLPGISSALSDINDLIENRIEEKVSAGKSKFDSVDNNIDSALADVEPLVKDELGKFGGDLKSYNSKFQSAMRDLNFPTAEPLPEITDDIVKYIYYLGINLQVNAELSFHPIINNLLFRIGNEWWSVAHIVILHSWIVLWDVWEHTK